MNEKQSVTLQRDLPHPPDKVWRALTQSELMGDWLMESDFRPEVGHLFTFRADWGEVQGEVLEVEPQRRLSYTWHAFALKSVVTFTLTAIDGGTRLEMMQTGFRTDQEQELGGAKAGWAHFLDALAGCLDARASEEGS